jgi:hypothetical protein
VATVISKYEQNLKKKHLGWAGGGCAEAGVTSDQRNERTLKRKSDETNAVIRANGVVSCLRSEETVVQGAFFHFANAAWGDYHNSCAMNEISIVRTAFGN